MHLKQGLVVIEMYIIGIHWRYLAYTFEFLQPPLPGCFQSLTKMLNPTLEKKMREL
jgi:hypothetical protein